MVYKNVYCLSTKKYEQVQISNIIQYYQQKSQSYRYAVVGTCNNKTSHTFVSEAEAENYRLQGVPFVQKNFKSPKLKLGSKACKKNSRLRQISDSNIQEFYCTTIKGARCGADAPNRRRDLPINGGTVLYLTNDNTGKMQTRYMITAICDEKKVHRFISKDNFEGLVNNGAILRNNIQEVQRNFNRYTKAEKKIAREKKTAENRARKRIIKKEMKMKPQPFQPNFNPMDMNFDQPMQQPMQQDVKPNIDDQVLEDQEDNLERFKSLYNEDKIMRQDIAQMQAQMQQVHPTVKLEANNEMIPRLPRQIQQRQQPMDINIDQNMQIQPPMQPLMQPNQRPVRQQRQLSKSDFIFNKPPPLKGPIPQPGPARRIRKIPNDSSLFNYTQPRQDQSQLQRLQQQQFEQQQIQKQQFEQQQSTQQTQKDWQEQQEQLAQQLLEKKFQEEQQILEDDGF
ncbi:MAG: hypothetical protein N2B06_08870 [Clostridium sp.]